jgi:phosphomannomutase
MFDILQRLRNKVAIGFVGGSDLAKQQEQLGVNGANGNPLPPPKKNDFFPT